MDEVQKTIQERLNSYVQSVNNTTSVSSQSKIDHIETLQTIPEKKIESPSPNSTLPKGNLSMKVIPTKKSNIEEPNVSETNNPSLKNGTQLKKILAPPTGILSLKANPTKTIQSIVTNTQSSPEANPETKPEANPEAKPEAKLVANLSLRATPIPILANNTQPNTQQPNVNTQPPNVNTQRPIVNTQPPPEAKLVANLSLRATPIPIKILQKSSNNAQEGTEKATAETAKVQPPPETKLVANLSLTATPVPKQILQKPSNNAQERTEKAETAKVQPPKKPTAILSLTATPVPTPPNTTIIKVKPRQIENQNTASLAARIVELALEAGRSVPGARDKLAKLIGSLPEAAAKLTELVKSSVSGKVEILKELAAEFAKRLVKQPAQIKQEVKRTGPTTKTLTAVLSLQATPLQTTEKKNNEQPVGSGTKSGPVESGTKSGPLGSDAAAKLAAKSAAKLAAESAAKLEAAELAAEEATKKAEENKKAAEEYAIKKAAAEKNRGIGDVLLFGPSYDPSLFQPA